MPNFETRLKKARSSHDRAKMATLSFKMHMGSYSYKRVNSYILSLKQLPLLLQ